MKQRKWAWHWSETSLLCDAMCGHLSCSPGRASPSSAICASDLHYVKPTTWCTPMSLSIEALSKRVSNGSRSKCIHPSCHRHAAKTCATRATDATSVGRQDREKFTGSVARRRKWPRWMWWWTSMRLCLQKGNKIWRSLMNLPLSCETGLIACFKTQDRMCTHSHVWNVESAVNG